VGGRHEQNSSRAGLAKDCESHLFLPKLENQMFVLLELLKPINLPPYVIFKAGFADVVPRQPADVAPRQP
jgi:hypothetical protein